MSRQLIGRALVKFYPAEVQHTRGNELIGTLLDAGDASTRAFLANAASLAKSGLSERARQELRRPVGQILVGALCWAAVLSAMSVVVEAIGNSVMWGGTIFSFGNDPETIIDMYVLPVLILALFTSGRNRTTGLLGLLRVAMRLHQSSMISLADFLITIPVPAVGFGLLAIRPRSIPHAGRYLWPIPAACLAFYWSTLLGQHSGIGRLTPILAAAVLLPAAPALALGLGIEWLLQGIGYLTYPGGDGYTLWTVEFLACLPVVLLLSAACRQAAKRPARAM
ncbi:MAG: hypothetical protein ACRDMJ_05900 [Solirubrobacteraceae bacterium]